MEGCQMVKEEFITGCTLRLDSLSRHKTEICVNIILELFSEAMTQGRRIEIRGFGSFRVKDMPAYTSRNPKSGEPAYVEAKGKIHFKPGKELRQRVNGGSYGR